MSAPGTSLDGRIPALLKEAAEWQLLARLFECPSSEWDADICRLAAEIGDDALCAAAAAAGKTATEGQYHSVFGPGGPAPPREASYRETLELGSLMSKLAGYYDAFGYAPVSSEAPDHIAIEVGFVAYLTLKEAYALAIGDAERAALAADAGARFRTEHLANVAAPLAALLANSHLEHLAQASRVLASRVGPAPRSARLPMAPTAESEDDSFECGT